MGDLAPKFCLFESKTFQQELFSTN